MEVASAAAERIDLPRPPLDPSLSQRASNVVSDSSTSPNGSSTTSTPDRYDPSNSSPNPSYREVDIQSPAALRSEEYRQLFRLPPEEFLVQDFNCAFQESILLQGHMYLFVRYLCFYSNIFAFETKFFFASFLSRDEAFKLINDGRKQHSTGAKEIKEQQLLVLHLEVFLSYAGTYVRVQKQRERIFAFVKENSSKDPINDMESTARDEDVPTSSESNVPSSANGAELVAESVTNTRSSAPADCSWKPDNSYAPEKREIGKGDRIKKKSEERLENMKKQRVNRVKENAQVSEETKLSYSFLADRHDAIYSPLSYSVLSVDILHPVTTFDYTFIFGSVMIISMGCFLCAVPEGFTKVAETKFQMKVEEFFNLYFSDKAVNFIESFHRRCGDKGANFGSCQETQKFRIYRNSHLVIEISQEINNVPYGDYFIVEGLWSVERDTNAQREDCILRVYVNLAFTRELVGKAHELLQQNNDKQGLDPSGSSIENGELQIKREAATKDPSERSHNSTDPVRTFQISDSSDVNQRIGNLWQGTKASSITYLFREVVRKSYGYLKSHGHISVVLGVAFTVMFLMQVSIIVLHVM
ncbi:hypothetical protein GOBAR_AA22532 [Gossypium barbadense]|uniref:VASt domain-containing protein n=1 Tax=Gossypium barbadense TaxID=3634 RepID=A0A2P5X497_GOSBA|nr:hypothetical protein GOBAR_AA22532 [Gossypium barbadense]